MLRILLSAIDKYKDKNFFRIRGCVFSVLKTDLIVTGGCVFTGIIIIKNIYFVVADIFHLTKKRILR